MKGRFNDFARVRLKPDIPRGAERWQPWPLPGQELKIICNVNEDYDLSALYRCEWDVEGKKPTQLFHDAQLEPWPE